MLVISVADTDGKEVRIKAGGDSERQLVEEVLTRLKELGVGFWKTEATVLTAVTQAIQETFYALKSDILP